MVAMYFLVPLCMIYLVRNINLFNIFITNAKFAKELLLIMFLQALLWQKSQVVIPKIFQRIIDLSPKLRTKIENWLWIICYLPRLSKIRKHIHFFYLKESFEQ